MTLAAKIATGFAGSLIAAVLAVEGAGIIFGSTWLGPEWMVARIACVNINKLGGPGKEKVEEFLHNRGKCELTITVQNNRIVAVNGEAVEEEESPRFSSSQDPKITVSGATEDASGDKEDGEIDSKVEESATTTASGTKVYKGWAAVWKWTRLATKEATPV